MKKRPFSRISLVFGNIFAFRKWFDYDRLKTYSSYFMTGIKKLFIPKSAQATVSFDEAMASQNMNEADLKKQEFALHRLSRIMCLFAFCFLTYAGYQLVYGSIRAVIISLIVMCVALTLGFRYHFWYFQIKNRKLGCTFHDWYNQGLRGKTK